MQAGKNKKKAQAEREKVWENKWMNMSGWLQEKNLKLSSAEQNQLQAANRLPSVDDAQ